MDQNGFDLSRTGPVRRGQQIRYGDHDTEIMTAFPSSRASVSSVLFISWERSHRYAHYLLGFGDTVYVPLRRDLENQINKSNKQVQRYSEPSLAD